MHHRFAYGSVASLTLLLAACGPGKAEPTTTDTTDATDTVDTGSSSDTDSTSTGTAPTTTTGAPGEEPFGFACMRLVRADSEDGDPFVGTAKIRATLHYEPCLIDYYVKAHPEQQIDGAEGPEVFAEWRQRLCSEPVQDPLVACEVDEFAQALDDSVPVHQMSVTYDITDAAQIDGRTLLWGPGPVAATASCPEGQLPTVKITLPSDVVGLDAGGQTLWSAQSWSDSRAQLQHDTQGCIQVDVASN